MSLQPDKTVSQQPQTTSKKSESRLKYAFAQNTALRALDRKVLEEGLRMQWKFFSEDDKMFGSLSIRGGYVAHNIGTWPWIPGAKEEQAFVDAYENMVKNVQGIPAEEIDNYSAYMEHRLRLATSIDGGKTLGPLLHEVLSNKVSNPEMRIAATEIKELKFQAAKALHPERYVNTNANDDMNVEHSRKKRKTSKEVTAKSLDGRSFALLATKTKTVWEWRETAMMGTILLKKHGSYTVDAKPLQDGKSQSQSSSKQNIESRAMGADKHLTNELPPSKRRSLMVVEDYTKASEEGDEKTSVPFDTRISARTPDLGTASFGTRTSGLRTSRLRTSILVILTLEALNPAPFRIPLSDFTKPLALLGKPNKKRTMTDEAEVEG
ncbi:uncharacterized protein EAF02_003105 [Botrytis sinoallii]|uniref:uncharacterized protein n=1 Tax=Botrytis sinoallii TaxID=1463999 RepID=UPI00190070E6|nr:uncharacterized protein EAF02_003105 [Botrytis sinoallii]KAF7888564.1 hypothetical protein EAF02_003105 [Botrytis sinoallii]